MDAMPDILTAKMIAEHLHLSVEQVYNLFKLSPVAGGIPSFSIGRSKRARKSEYVKWLAAKGGQG
jgi:DNA-binding XRE family transcriptional regulator